jgi:hypothetical protein
MCKIVNILSELKSYKEGKKLQSERERKRKYKARERERVA